MMAEGGQEATGRDQILENIQRCISVAHRCFETHDVDCNLVLIDLNRARRSLSVIRAEVDDRSFVAVDQTLAALIEQLTLRMQHSTSESESFTAARVNGGRGRPAVVIPLDQLKMMYDLNYTAPQMAKQFGCSQQLVYTKLHAAGLKMRDRYTTFSDGELDNKVSQLQSQFPNAGSVMMHGYLQAQSVTMQRKRIRESATRTSPAPVIQRLAKTVKRRRYAVSMSNSLWHMDGHMKLIRWGISTHGCIDGYSRLITFLHADTDNKASTVLKHFVHACDTYGVPSRVRTDQGRENLMVALFVNLVNGEDRHSFIAGKSVHNQRIERLWKDVFTQVIEKYYNKFYNLEEQGVLDSDNSFHVLALQIVYVPIINKELHVFQKGWNSHKLSSESNNTPEQLWLNGVLKKINSNAMPITNMLQNSVLEHLEDQLRRYGLDPDSFELENDVIDEGILTTEQKDQLLSTLTEELSPEEKFRKCLDFFDRSR